MVDTSSSSAVDLGTWSAGVPVAYVISDELYQECLETLVPRAAVGLFREADRRGRPELNCDSRAARTLRAYKAVEVLIHPAVGDDDEVLGQLTSSTTLSPVAVIGNDVILALVVVPQAQEYVRKTRAFLCQGDQEIRGANAQSLRDAFERRMCRPGMRAPEIMYRRIKLLD